LLQANQQLRHLGLRLEERVERNLPLRVDQVLKKLVESIDNRELGVE
jgi:hypothetical protein